MTLIAAIKAAKAQGAATIYRTDNPWREISFLREAQTILADDRKAQDWQVVEVDRMTIYSGWSGLQ